MSVLRTRTESDKDGLAEALGILLAGGLAVGFEKLLISVKLYLEVMKVLEEQSLEIMSLITTL